MSFVRARMHCNSISPESFTIFRHLDYIRQVSTTGISNEGNFIDVDRQASHILILGKNMED